MMSCYVEPVTGRRTCDRHVVWIEGLLCSRITSGPGLLWRCTGDRDLSPGLAPTLWKEDTSPAPKCSQEACPWRAVFPF